MRGNKAFGWLLLVALLGGCGIRKYSKKSDSPARLFSSRRRARTER